MDTVLKQVRSRMMAAVPQTHSEPEMVVRRIAHRLGFRFRLHRRDLPGSPDVVFPRLGKVIFVHGCFWHRHGCSKATTPMSNVAFWDKKLSDNQRRDRRVAKELKAQGWGVLIVWECETSRLEHLQRRLLAFLYE